MIDSRWALWLLFGNAVLLVALIYSGFAPNGFAKAALLTVPLIVLADLVYRFASEPDQE